MSTDLSDTTTKTPAWLGLILGIDPRSLEVFRIGMGLSLMFDLVSRLPDFSALHGVDGVLPLGAAIAVDPGLQSA